MRGPIKMAPETRGRTDKGLQLLSRTLEGLSLSSKARLRYDYDWKPTEEAIDICSSSLKVHTVVRMFLVSLQTGAWLTTITTDSYDVL